MGRCPHCARVCMAAWLHTQAIKQCLDDWHFRRISLPHFDSIIDGSVDGEYYDSTLRVAVQYGSCLLGQLGSLFNDTYCMYHY